MFLKEVDGVGLKFLSKNSSSDIRHVLLGPTKNPSVYKFSQWKDPFKTNHIHSFLTSKLHINQS